MEFIIFGIYQYKKTNVLLKFRSGFSSFHITSFHLLYKLVQAGTSWYQSRKDFLRFADVLSGWRRRLAMRIGPSLASRLGE